MPMADPTQREAISHNVMAAEQWQQWQHFHEFHAGNRPWQADITMHGSTGGSPLIRTMFYPLPQQHSSRRILGLAMWPRCQRSTTSITMQQQDHLALPRASGTCGTTSVGLTHLSQPIIHFATPTDFRHWSKTPCGLIQRSHQSSQCPHNSDNGSTCVHFIPAISFGRRRKERASKWMGAHHSSGPCSILQQQMHSI